VGAEVRPPTGTPERVKRPGEGLRILYAAFYGRSQRVVLNCAHRTNTASPCAFCEQEEHPRNGFSTLACCS
jgi:hypothetical protein